MGGRIVEERRVDLVKRKNITTPFCFGAPRLVCKKKPKQKRRTGLVRAGSHRFERLLRASWVVVVELGVGTTVACVPYCCAAV